MKIYYFVLLYIELQFSASNWKIRAAFFSLKGSRNASNEIAEVYDSDTAKRKSRYSKKRILFLSWRTEYSIIGVNRIFLL